MRVWVIGGSSGIGLAVWHRLLKGGLDHYVMKSGQEVNVRDLSQLRDFNREHGPFEGIVYSAGVNNLQWSSRMQEPAMLIAKDLYDVNCLGLVRTLVACKEATRVVVVGSDAARRPMRTSLAYCASKAALSMAVKVIARERASENFVINEVAPGMTDGTGMTEYIDEQVPHIRGWTKEYAARYESSQIGLHRRATPDEIAEVVCNVLLMETPYLNGATIEVNGGR